MADVSAETVSLSPARVDAWSALRHDLWPDASVAEHVREAAHLIAQADACCVLLATCKDEFVGVAEAALRRDYVNGCDTSPLLPVAFLEGFFVRPSFRRRGIARLQCERIAAWARTQGAREFASGALVDNTASHAMHRALGFSGTQRVVFFRKDLSP